VEDRRSGSERTIPHPPYRFGFLGPLASRPALADSVSASRARPRRSGPAQCNAAWVCSDPARCFFFLESYYPFSNDLQLAKFVEK
jgi:hypothetical protein